MALFSERYGYVKPREVLIREAIPIEIQNAICSAFDLLRECFGQLEAFCEIKRYYRDLELAIWLYFENKRRDNFYTHYGHRTVATVFLESDAVWYRKLDMLEFTIKWMANNYNDHDRSSILNSFIEYLNSRFEELGFAYRIIKNNILEITSEQEIAEIEQATATTDAASNHLISALALLAKRPDPDYRNSIKEAISAVEFICRSITDKTTLGDSLKELEKRGVRIPKMLKSAFEKLYVYTNDGTTGIRHALMDDTEVPDFAEAKFMLVACCAFVNYLRAKVQNNH